MRRTRLILVGGFLGAGKTTLVARAAQGLVERGYRVGLVTNDQAANLVDTAILKRAGGSPVEEVAGGCFCCKFEDLLGSVRKLLHRHQPDVILGEPVGSCTDLSATVIQRLKKDCHDWLRVAPFSVLVDTSQVGRLDRLRQSLAQADPARLPDSVLYIYQKQLEEADLIVLNKTDAVGPTELAELERWLSEQIPGVPHLPMAALTGDGVERWLDYVFDDRPAGQRIAEVDYDTYARGEAMLGWLNASVRLQASGPTKWSVICRKLLAAMRQECLARGLEIAHVKLHLNSGHGELVASLGASDGQPSLRGWSHVSAGDAVLLLNARVRATPEQLRSVVERSLEAMAGKGIRVTVKDLQSFSPARPQPVHRFDRVVDSRP